MRQARVAIEAREFLRARRPPQPHQRRQRGDHREDEQPDADHASVARQLEPQPQP